MKNLKQTSPEEWENNIFEYDGQWHKKSKDGNCEPFIMADLKELLAQLKQKWVEDLLKKIKKLKAVEADFLNWHSDMPITTEIKKEARIWRDIFNLGLKTLAHLLTKEKLSKLK